MPPRRQNEELRQLRHQLEPPVQVVYPAAKARHEMLVERFRKQHSPEFEGGIDPVVAEEWMTRIENILQMLKENAARRESKKGGTNFNDNKKKEQDQAGQSSQDKRYKAENDRRSNGNNGRNVPKCPKCTKRHLRECRANACYKCGKEGHIKRNCPLWGQTENKEDLKEDDKYVPTRVFAIKGAGQSVDKC
ncbi:uncharacterized protein LOC133036235 [Cannabis sativa]|uniref:uncharacterized protein LOC133036235 n=1 Tax=Cannabis sativa TaxID=3483 RepID=UPI0029C9C59A|nr:uncharacterized protein LOC133036235 [Cannabis sativa]